MCSYCFQMGKLNNKRRRKGRHGGGGVVGGAGGEGGSMGGSVGVVQERGVEDGVDDMGNKQCCCKESLERVLKESLSMQWRIRGLETRNRCLERDLSRAKCDLSKSNRDNDRVRRVLNKSRRECGTQTEDGVGEEDFDSDDDLELLEASELNCNNNESDLKLEEMF